VKAFKLFSPFKPCGDQPKAIKELMQGLQNKKGNQVLMGVTGSGKTFTMANIIAQINKPALIISHNKTLAAQLASEFKTFFPENAVEYFVSYYDYYQPEAYIPQTDTYIEKDSAINEQIDRLRHSATHSVLTRKDVIVVASVSCIYGLGSPEDYQGLNVVIESGMEMDRDIFLKKLIAMRYERNDIEFKRGTFRARGDIVDVFPAYEEDKAIRVEFFGDVIESIHEINSLKGNRQRELKKEILYPASHYVIPEEKLGNAITSIEEELERNLKELEVQGKVLEYQRLRTRTRYDLEMMREIGYCQGIENYSRHFSGRNPGEPPYTLLDYFKDFIIFIDESHVAIPQIRGMYEGDKSRKANLVGHGFRLPSAFDNRPLKFNEFEKYLKSSIFVSATPASYEILNSHCVVEQIIRPTGLMDPEIDLRKAEGQVDDLIFEIRKQVEKNERTLVTTLTKKMAEDLSSYLNKIDIKVHYLHSEIDTFKRLKILKQLRTGEYDVIVGVNLLREGLDLPEVSLVAILDADKEGFLRNERSLIQTMGRASRNVNGRVVLYADKLTDSLKKAIHETERRRKIQRDYNEKHNITPTTIKKFVKDLVDTSELLLDYEGQSKPKNEKENILIKMVAHEDISVIIMNLEHEMMEAAKNLEFEKAAKLRDKIATLNASKI